jgi:hypothetical protein
MMNSHSFRQQLCFTGTTFGLREGPGCFQLRQATLHRRDRTKIDSLISLHETWISFLSKSARVTREPTY